MASFVRVKYKPNLNFSKNVKGKFDDPLAAIGAQIRTAVKRTIRTPTQGQIEQSRIFDPKKKRIHQNSGRPPSMRGKPPRSHRPRRVLRNSFIFGVNRITKRVSIGQRELKRGLQNIAIIHETGRGTFPMRPFMKPTLDKFIESGKIPLKFRNIL